MKKIGYCNDCRLEFEYQINNMEEYNNVFCPKCRKRVSNNYVKPKQISKADVVAGSIFSKTLKIYFYFYLIMSTIALTFYILGNKSVFITLTTISLVLYIIELLLGYTRNILGLGGMIISISICSYILNDIKMGIYLGSCIIFILTGLLRLLFIFIIVRIDEKTRKNKLTKNK